MWFLCVKWKSPDLSFWFYLLCFYNRGKAVNSTRNKIKRKRKAEENNWRGSFQLQVGADSVETNLEEKSISLGILFWHKEGRYNWTRRTECTHARDKKILSSSWVWTKEKEKNTLTKSIALWFTLDKGRRQRRFLVLTLQFQTSTKVSNCSMEIVRSKNFRGEFKVMSG